MNVCLANRRERLREVCGLTSDSTSRRSLRRLGAPREIAHVVAFSPPTGPPTSPGPSSPWTALRAVAVTAAASPPGPHHRRAHRARRRALGAAVGQLPAPATGRSHWPGGLDPGERGDAQGGIYYVDVIVRKASLLGGSCRAARRRQLARARARDPAARLEREPAPAAEPACDERLATGRRRRRSARAGLRGRHAQGRRARRERRARRPGQRQAAAGRRRRRGGRRAGGDPHRAAARDLDARARRLGPARRPRRQGVARRTSDDRRSERRGRALGASPSSNPSRSRSRST